MLQGDVWKQLNLSVLEEKFRPVQSVAIHFMIVFFGKNVLCYYLFNVAIQAFNTLILYRILQFLAPSNLSAFLFSLIFCISKFTFFNISQLIYGATQEGFSTGFFLLSLLYLIRAVKQPEASRKAVFGWMLWSVFFANLSIYSHERYLPMLAFIGLSVVLFKLIRNLSTPQRLGIIGLVIGSVVFNFVIKSYVLHLTFFKGTGGQDIVFDYNSAVMYYTLAIQWLFEINIGSPVIVGLPYDDLRDFYLGFVSVLIGSVIVLTVLYLTGVIVAAVKKQEFRKRQFPLFLLLLLLALLLIVPATLTIRLEHRWLQGPYALLIMLLAIAVNGFAFNGMPARTIASFIMATLFLWIDVHYFTSGINQMYIRTSDRFIGKFHDAVRDGRIKKSTTTLLIYEDVTSKGDQDWINWVTNEGYIFNMFNEPHKAIQYIDSTTNRPVSAINDTTQIIYVYDTGIDTIDDKTRHKKI